MVLDQVFTLERTGIDVNVYGHELTEESISIKFKLELNTFSNGIKSIDVKIVYATITFDDGSYEDITSFELDNQVTTEAGFIIDSIDVDFKDKTLTLY